MKTHKAMLDAAFRTRQGAIGVLQSCLCTYPLELADTSTGHDEKCPGHLIMLSLNRLETQAAG